MRNINLLILTVFLFTFNSCTHNYKLRSFEGEWRLEKFASNYGTVTIPYEGEVTLEIEENNLKGYLDNEYYYEAKLDIKETELYADYLIVEKKCLEGDFEVFSELNGQIDFYLTDEGFNLVAKYQDCPDDCFIYYFVEK